MATVIPMDTLRQLLPARVVNMVDSLNPQDPQQEVDTHVLNRVLQRVPPQDLSARTELRRLIETFEGIDFFVGQHLQEVVLPEPGTPLPPRDDLLPVGAYQAKAGPAEQSATVVRLELDPADPKQWIFQGELAGTKLLATGAPTTREGAYVLRGEATPEAGEPFPVDLLLRQHGDKSKPALEVRSTNDNNPFAAQIAWPAAVELSTREQVQLGLAGSDTPQRPRRIPKRFRDTYQLLFDKPQKPDATAATEAGSAGNVAAGTVPDAATTLRQALDTLLTPTDGLIDALAAAVAQRQTASAWSGSETARQASDGLREAGLPVVSPLASHAVPGPALLVFDRLTPGLMEAVERHSWQGHNPLTLVYTGEQPLSDVQALALRRAGAASVETWSSETSLAGLVNAFVAHKAAHHARIGDALKTARLHFDDPAWQQSMEQLAAMVSAKQFPLLVRGDVPQGLAAFIKSAVPSTDLAHYNASYGTDITSYLQGPADSVLVVENLAALTQPAADALANHLKSGRSPHIVAVALPNTTGTLSPKEHALHMGIGATLDAPPASLSAAQVKGALDSLLQARDVKDLDKVHAALGQQLTVPFAPSRAELVGLADHLADSSTLNPDAAFSTSLTTRVRLGAALERAGQADSSFAYRRSVAALLQQAEAANARLDVQAAPEDSAQLVPLLRALADPPCLGRSKIVEASTSQLADGDLEALHIDADTLVVVRHDDGTDVSTAGPAFDTAFAHLEKAGAAMLALNAPLEVPALRIEPYAGVGAPEVLLRAPSEKDGFYSIGAMRLFRVEDLFSRGFDLGTEVHGLFNDATQAFAIPAGDPTAEGLQTIVDNWRAQIETLRQNCSEPQGDILNALERLLEKGLQPLAQSFRAEEIQQAAAVTQKSANVRAEKLFAMVPAAIESLQSRGMAAAQAIEFGERLGKLVGKDPAATLAPLRKREESFESRAADLNKELKGWWHELGRYWGSAPHAWLSDALRAQGVRGWSFEEDNASTSLLETHASVLDQSLRDYMQAKGYDLDNAAALKADAVMASILREYPPGRVWLEIIETAARSSGQVPVLAQLYETLASSPNRVALAQAVDAAYETRLKNWPGRIATAFERGERETVERLLGEYDEAKEHLGATDDDPKVADARANVANLPFTELGTLLAQYPRIADKVECLLVAMAQSEKQD